MNYGLKAQFRSEAFVQIGGNSAYSGFEELLCIQSNAERFFASASNDKIHQIFSQAFGVGIGRSVTINIQPSALFDMNFLPVLMSALENYPGIDRRKVCIEITEHGGVPKEFNPRLLQFLKEMGFKLALDDFDPRSSEELKRLDILAPYMDIIKFPFQVMEAFRNKEKREEISSLIRSTCFQYPDKVIVMEGVRKEEMHFMMPALKDVGIDYVQISKYHEHQLAKGLNPLMLALTY
jgi:EAL domain-containing protein (putative c-di-GMP-specific phosphodiesterase class I)